jgi:hypothetical protein
LVVGIQIHASAYARSALHQRHTSVQFAELVVRA